MSEDNDYDDEVAAATMEDDEDEEDLQDAEEEDEDDHQEAATVASDDNDDEQEDEEDASAATGEEDADGATTPVPSEGGASEAVVVADDAEDEDDEDDVVASVVIEEGSTVGEGDNGGGPNGNGHNKNHSSSKRKRPGPKPKRKRTMEDRLDVARDAKAMLRHMVRKLPMPVGDTHIIRSLGRLHCDDSRYSNHHHIYPAGFSCDRFEFSPVHGRILKMRCTILDGAKIRAKQQELGVPVTVRSGGPLFRIMWGAGVDDDSERPLEYSYNLETNSPAVRGKSKGGSGAKDQSGGGVNTSPSVEPEEGMRVRVKYDQDQWFAGTIVDVDEGRKGEVEITIQYDDGTSEHTSYPDPDITIFRPGSEDEAVEDGVLNVTEMNGKPVTTVVSSSAIKAWGTAMIAMGLIDEITLKKGLGAMKKHLEDDEDDEEKKEDDGDEASREDASEEEIALRQQIQEALKVLEEARAEDRQATIDLTDARLANLGPFLCNPFQMNQGSQYPQEMSWLSTIIRKEKAKMGSTGNKKKVITTVDLLDRNNTFFNPDIEALIEGLPGSEQLQDYMFQSFRFGFVPPPICESWIQNAHLRQQTPPVDKKRKIAAAVSSAKSAKSAIDLEKEVKRQKREDERDARKRQKDEEEEQKKRARAEERMSRLNMQVEDRLFKEACFQREKVIVAMAKSMSREYNRRKKAAELVAMQSVMDASVIRPVSSLHGSLPDLSPLCQIYDEDVLRCWDFITSYGEAMIKWGYMEKLPTLDSLQHALDGLRKHSISQSLSGSRMSRNDAIDYLTNLCIALCKPLAVSLTRLLFASLIALNPALQKDFGAAFFAEVRTNATKEEAEGPTSSDLLPVNRLTWQEIARLAFLSDALGELGNAKHEIAHILRGYRSMGHPNSKEAKRLRKTEDYPIAVLRQTITQGASEEFNLSSSGETRVRILAPSKASAGPLDWQFYIHNIKGMNAKNVSLIKSNLEKAINIVKKPEMEKLVDGETKAELHKAMSVLSKVAKEDEPTPSEISTCSKARMSLLRLLDKVTGEVYSTDLVKEVVHRENFDHGVKPETVAVNGEPQTWGRKCLPKELSMNESDYKDLVHKREEYMADALRLKGEMENQGDDDDEEEDDDDDDKSKQPAESEKTDDAGGSSESNEAQKSSKEIGGGSESAEVVATVVENGDSAKNDIPTKIGKVTPHDDFAGDIPTAPELIRRCLAVLRTLSMTQSAEPFIYPVDPQTNPGYYETVLQPMCMQEVGKRLITASKKCIVISDKDELKNYVESVVAEFGRNVRIIAQNCSCYSNAGATVIAAGDELLRIFERLLLDWVLAPRNHLPTLDDLDDDRCVEFHESDEDSMVLLCDGCEGKYNMSRLVPPLRDVPKGDWFCPRCLTGRCWELLDPRIGKTVVSGENGEKVSQEVVGCQFVHPDNNVKPKLFYVLQGEGGQSDLLPVEELDKHLMDAGESIDPVQCIEALSESPGYSRGPNRGIYENLVPVPINPSISDAAAQAITSSSVYQDTIVGSSAFMLVNPEDLQATEWSRLLTLLVMNCASSEMINSVASQLEAAAAEKMPKMRNESARCDIKAILPLTNVEEMDEVPTQAALPVSENLAKETKENGDAAAVVVDSNAIEVVEDFKMEKMESVVPIAQVSSNGDVEKIPDPVVSEEMLRKQARALTIEERARRYRMREEGFVAHSIKNQLRSTVSSFEEDNVSVVIESSLGSREKGLNLTSSRCRGPFCDFCGLSDVALGSPLLRVPNFHEWYELMPHMTRDRRVFLLADMREGACLLTEGATLQQSMPKKSRNKDLVAVKITIGGELVSCADDDDHFEDIGDGGMMEYLPRNEDGCQYELRARHDGNLPFVTGSLSAHECCAVSAHNARKERVITEHNAKKMVSLEADAGMLCGRTLSIGNDSAGRSYWRFKADNALFVCESESSKVWRRYTDPDVIASIIHGLGKDPIASEIRKTFPEAARLLRGRKWSQMLQKRQFLPKSILETTAESPSSRNEGPEEHVMERDGEDEEPYQVGEDVLVESKCGRMLWDGKVIAISNKDNKVNGYRVRYLGWSSRFDEWVTPFRVVEPSDNNTDVQQEMIKELQSNKLSAPDPLKHMAARKHVNSKDRARNVAIIPDFIDVAKVSPTATSGEKAFALAKAALLMIEAALPCGAIDTSAKGAWRPGYAVEWRKVVQTASGPYTVMACAFLLEENIDPEWMDPHVVHLLSCLPQRWKAIREATVSSVCLRLAMLDQGVQYDTVDRLKYVSKSKK